MRRKLGIIVIAMLMIALMLAGCAQSNFGVVINEDGSVGITAENAKVDSNGMAATFTVGEGEDVLIENALDEGSILLQFYILTEELNEGNMIPEGEPDYEIEVSGTEPVTCGFGAGDFIVSATVKAKANGTVTIRPKAQ